MMPTGIRVRELDTSVGFSMWQFICALHEPGVVMLDQESAIAQAGAHAFHMHGTRIFDCEVWYLEKEPVR